MWANEPSLKRQLSVDTISIDNTLPACLGNTFYFLSDEGTMLETLDHTIRFGSTPTFLYFDLYLYSAYAAHYVYYNFLPFQNPQ